MVPSPPSLSRRRLLGGAAALLAGGTVVGVGAKRPTALPDPVTDQASKLYPTPPELDTHWRVTVTESHASEAVDALAETVSEAETLWQQTETDDRFTGAGGWLESAREELRDGNYHDALFAARYGMQFAAEQLGVAQYRLGRFDRDAAADRAQGLRTRSEAVADSLTPYPTTDPPRDLAWYYRIEWELASARLQLDESRFSSTDTETGETVVDHPREAGELLANLREGRLAIRAAERYRDLLVEQLGGQTTAFDGHLASVADRFASAIDAFPSRDEVIAASVPESEREDNEVTPYEFAHDRLARWCFDTNYRFGLDRSPDLQVFTTVGLSTGLAQRRAHEFAVSELVVDREASGFDSGHVLAEKRRARDVYQSVVGSNPPPLLTIQVRRAVEDLQVAKVGFGGSARQPRWRERLEAYLYALVGRAKLRAYPRVYEETVNR